METRHVNVVLIVCFNALRLLTYGANTNVFGCAKEAVERNTDK